MLPAAEIAFANGDADRAIGIAEETIERCRLHHHVVVEVLARANLAGYLLAAGAFEKARDQAMAAIDLGQQMDPEIDRRGDTSSSGGRSHCRERRSGSPAQGSVRRHARARAVAARSNESQQRTHVSLGVARAAKLARKLEIDR